MKKNYFQIFLIFVFYGCIHTPKQNWAPFDFNYAWNSKGHAARISTYDKTGANNDSIQIKPGETATLADIKGPGIIRRIWMTSNGAGPIGRTLIIRMYWDGSEKPSVEVPYGDFFGVGNGLTADVFSFPITVVSNGRSKNSWWQMPFSKGAKITVTNEGAQPQGAFYCHIDYLALDDVPPTTERFHAQYRQAYPANMPSNYVILDTKGKGHYVGTVMSFVGTKPNWWGEGDELIEADNYEPIRGTGTEEYFGDAWGMRQHFTLWHGSPICEGYDEAGLNTSMYRFHILDPIPFNNKLKISIEHGAQNDRADNISSVAYWYQEPPASEFPPMPTLIERLLGETRATLIRQLAWQTATQNLPDTIQKLTDYLNNTDKHEDKLLIQGMLIFSESLTSPSDEALSKLDNVLNEMNGLISLIPEEERYEKPRIELPTDNDDPVPKPIISNYKILEKAHHQLSRKTALKRGFKPGDEIIVEARDVNGDLTPPPTYKETPDFTNSYAKVDDPHLTGNGARFTYGNADPSWARFTPDFPKSGTYEVFVIFSYGANADDTRYEVRHTTGIDTIPLKQRGRPNTPDRNNNIWHSLGKYHFKAGQNIDKGSITLQVSPGNALPNPKFEYRAYADSVRFVFLNE